jgi:protoheme IX farnesyltransferase
MLSLDRFEDYANANVPMLPNTHGTKETLKQSLFYVLLLWPITFLPLAHQIWGKFYGASMIILNIIFTYSLLKEGKSSPRKVFGISILYLFLLFTSILIDAWIRQLS